MNKISVLYTTDHNYINYLQTSLYSLLESNPKLDINIHIVHDKFEKEDFIKIENIINKFNNANVIFHEFGSIERKIDKYNIPNWRNTKIANARLFFTDVVKDEEKLLYLDSDTFVINGIEGLNMFDEPVNMVRDVMPKEEINRLNCGIKRYFNSGVIWINVKNWLKNDYDKRIADTFQKGLILRYPDQDTINISFKNEIGELPPRYNLFTTDYYYNISSLKSYYKQSNISRYSTESIRIAKNHPIILHGTPIKFTKTYEIKNTLHPYNKYYNYYMKKIDSDYKPKKDATLSEKIVLDIGLHAKTMVSKNTREKVKKLIKK